MDTAELARAADETSGGGGGRTYVRDPAGSTTGGQFTANPAGASYSPLTSGRTYQVTPKKGGGGGSAPTAPRSSAKFKTLSIDGDNDPQAVAEMQQLLTALGLGNLTSGVYDKDTEAAVMEAQRRLGIKKPNGKATKSLINKMLNAYDLSPCIQRSEDCDDTFTVTRSEGDVFDTLRAAVEDDETDETVARAYTSNPDEPYGDVAYADPGYQDDGKKRYPLDSEEHCRAAWSYINQADNAAKYSPEQLAHIKGKIKAALKRYGVQTDDSSRSDTPDTHEILRYERLWALDDIAIRAGGDGRTVEAYAAVFDTPTEIRDKHGHYMEVINRSAFNRAISHGIERIGVFYHHAMSMHGTPASGPGSVPIGRPIDVRPDGKGLRTVTRYNEGEFADAILEAIRNNALRGYSFRGQIFRSTPNRVPPSKRDGALPTIVRNELGLNEYGPTPTPAYDGAGILAVRSALAVADQVVSLDPEERKELIRILAVSTPADPETDDTATPDMGLGTEDAPEGHSGRLQQFREELRRRGVLK